MSIALMTLFLEPFHETINTATVALAFLLLILFIATFLGRNPALVASFAAMLCFNYFFLPPVRTLTIAAPQNLIAWAAFLITAITAGELSAYAKRRAEEAERQKKEIERLYEELKAAFAAASEAEALRQSEKLKSALLDAVTHDLRTPLTSIKVLATTLLDSEGGHRTLELDSESKYEFLETIVAETNRLNQFIEGMVELAQIEAGSMHLRRGWDEIAEIIEAAVFRAENLLRNRRITLKLEENLPLVRVDSKSLAEVIYTLLDNAAKYSPDGSKIEITARNADSGSIEISVADEGEGVPPELREKIFDKFFRVEETAKSANKPKGMGLGLAIAKGIIEAHGGKIRAAENPNGRGAMFVLTVPIGDE
jgi:K+-sensing histidine kinase KdpD